MPSTCTRKLTHKHTHARTHTACKANHIFVIWPKSISTRSHNLFLPFLSLNFLLFRFILCHFFPFCGPLPGRTAELDIQVFYLYVQSSCYSDWHIYQFLPFCSDKIQAQSLICDGKYNSLEYICLLKHMKNRLCVCMCACIWVYMTGLPAGPFMLNCKCLCCCKLLCIAVNSYFCLLPVRPILKSAMMSFFCCPFILTAAICFLDYWIWTSHSALRMSVMNIRRASCLTIQNAPNWNAEKTALANQLRDVVHSWQIIKRIWVLKSLLPPL